MSDKKPNPKSVHDYVNINEKEWLSISIVLVIVSIIGVGLAYVWVFCLSDNSVEMQQKASALSPFGVALFALVTFCTVAWRGAISTRQADESEHENRARLLQEGANLISKGDAASASAGLATLELLVTGLDSRFSVQAMNVVADFVQDKFAEDHQDKLFDHASAVLRTGFNNGVISDRNIIFHSSSADTAWKTIVGAKIIEYDGGYIEKWREGNKLPEKQIYSFRNVKFIYVQNMKISDYFYKCNFLLCSINSLDGMLFQYNVAEHTFNSCNFSGCIFPYFSNYLNYLKDGGNFFKKDTPPKIIENGNDLFVNWEDILTMQEPKVN